jgi:hypothetical protein
VPWGRNADFPGEVRASFAAAVVAATLLIPSAEASAQLEPAWVTAANDGTTLRACADAKCDVAGSLPAGTTVLVMREERGWYWVDVPKEHRVANRIQSTWVRVEDVRSAVVAERKDQAAKAAPLWKDAEIAAADASGSGTLAAGPATSTEACLTCAAPKAVTGSVMLTVSGLAAAGGPGPGDPDFDANVERGIKKFGGRLLGAKKRADLAQTKVNTYFQRCYEKHVQPEDRPGAPAVKPRGARPRPVLTWGQLASSSSPYAWSDAWVTRSTGTMQIMRYCGDLWLGIQKESGDLQATASDISSRALDEKIYPQAIHRLLVAYNLK